MYSPTSENPLPVCVPVPVSLPDVDGLGVVDVVLQRLLVQQVEEVLDGQRDGPAGAEDGSEQVVHELLQRSLRRIRRHVVDVVAEVSFAAVAEVKVGGTKLRDAACGTFMESSRVR